MGFVSRDSYGISIDAKVAAKLGNKKAVDSDTKKQSNGGVCSATVLFSILFDALDRKYATKKYLRSISAE